jgi:NhaA family Na+:H+ antiporter
MARPLPKSFQRFFQTETAGAILLMACSIAGLVLANSPLADAYQTLGSTTLMVGTPGHFLSLAVRQWINDGLMSVFFLLVGLEIKRELIAGELSMPKQAALPIAGAVGGMVFPALFYWVFNPGGAASSGWGIPMATDIAFALGALALLAPNVPTGAKVFLAALAIVDDMGAVVVIALFYSDDIAWAALGSAGVVTIALIVLNTVGIRQLWPYLTLGVILWYFVHASGIHATIAGVVLALTIPTRTRINAVEFSRKARALLDEFDRTETGDFVVLTSKGQQEALFALERASEWVNAPLLRLEHGLHRFSAFAVMPLFAFVNAGVSLSDNLPAPSVAIGVFTGLLLGKPIGITLASYVAVRSGIAVLPEGVRWATLHGCSWLGGIGFTMSLFIAMLAFEDAALLASAKIGILVASLCAGLVAALLVRAGGRTERR